MSWFLRGAQSAVFYYASCTPWHKYKHQRRRKQQNHADRAAREAYEKELQERDPYHASKTDPEMVYRQPSPQATNEFWADEIHMGPGPPPKRAKKQKLHKETTVSRRDLERQLTPAATPRPPDIVVEGEKPEWSKDGAGDGDTRDSKDSEKTYSPPQHALDELPRHSNVSRKSSTRISAEDAKWNHQRFYQREDEELWGVSQSSANPTVSDVNLQRTRSSTNKDLPFPAIYSRPQSSRSRPHAASTASTASITTTRSHFSAHLNVRAVAQAAASTESIYTAPRAPPVNDDHPPVANNPLHSKKVLTKWMLQPTPAPSVMSGKKQVRRSTAGSADSVPLSRPSSGKGSVRRERPDLPPISTDGDAVSMRRQLSARLLAEKMKENSRSEGHADDGEGNDADVEEDD